MAKTKIEPEKKQTFQVTIGGFRTKKAAMAFLDWYEGGGEQDFGDHLDIQGKQAGDGCYIDVARKGNKGRYYDDLPEGYYAEVQRFTPDKE